MERRRKEPESVSDEEENSDRRASLRKRYRLTYSLYFEENNNVESQEEEDEEEDEEDEEEGDEGEGEEDGDEEEDQQPGPSTQNNHDHKTAHRFLTVTCGNKQGNMDVEKLRRGEECILCKGRWYTPPAFEEFGGKGSSKKWKTSILHNNKPLQFLFEQGHLTTKGYKRRGHGTTKPKKTPSIDYMSDSSSEEESESVSDEEENSDRRTSPRKRWRATYSPYFEENENVESQEEEEEEEEEEEGGEGEEDGDEEEDQQPGPSTQNDHDHKTARQSETSAEETEEDKVGDEDWLPASQNEEESVEVVDSEEVNESKEEEDAMEQGETEDDSIPARADSDTRIREERVNNSTPEKCALQKEVKVRVKRLPEDDLQRMIMSEHEFNYAERPLKDSCGEPSHDDAPNEEESEHNAPAIDDTAATHNDSSPMSDPPTVGCGETEIGEECSQSTKNKKVEHTQTQTETMNSPTLATSLQDVKPKIKDIRSSSSSTAHLGTSPVLTDTAPNTGIAGDMKERQTEETGPEMPSHLEASRSEASGLPFDTGNIRDVPSAPTMSDAEEKRTEAKCGGPPTKAPSVPVKRNLKNTDATSSGHKAAEFQVIKMSQASDVPQSSDMVEAPPSRPTASCDLDSMDFDQLRREKMKMQIKVLRLQEEYYIQKMKKMKLEMCSLEPDC